MCTVGRPTVNHLVGSPPDNYIFHSIEFPQSITLNLFGRPTVNHLVGSPPYRQIYSSIHIESSQVDLLVLINDSAFLTGVQQKTSEGEKAGQGSRQPVPRETVLPGHQGHLLRQIVIPLNCTAPMEHHARLGLPSSRAGRGRGVWVTLQLNLNSAHSAKLPD
jgi:hypothetical protein